jgi:hypothetical protein
VTRYELFRKRIAPVAFIAAIALLAKQSCDKQEHATATFVLELGEAERDVRAIDADLFANGEPIAHFHRVALEGVHMSAPRFEAPLPGKQGELRIDVDLAGTHRLITRSVHAESGAVVTVDLARDLTHP